MAVNMGKYRLARSLKKRSLKAHKVKAAGNAAEVMKIKPST